MVKSTKDLLAKLLSQEGQTPKVSVHRCKKKLHRTEE